MIIEPIKPEELKEELKVSAPDNVIERLNELIGKKYKGGCAIVPCSEIGFPVDWETVIDVYKAVGWEVSYILDYDSVFTFRHLSVNGVIEEAEE